MLQIKMQQPKKSGKKVLILSILLYTFYSKNSDLLILTAP